MRLFGSFILAGSLALGGIEAHAAADVPGNANSQAKLPTGSKGIDGDLFGVGDSDWYRVQLDRDYTYGVRVDTACSYTEISLLDRHGNILKTAKGDYEYVGFISHRTSYGGLYYVAVKSTGTFTDCLQSPASYSGHFHLLAVRECGQDAHTRCVLPASGSVTSEIVRWDDKDWFKVDVPSPDTYTFRISAPLDVDGFIFTPKLSLRRADSSVIADSDQQGAHTCPRAADNGPCLRASLKAGRYYVAVRSPDGGTGYRLGAQPSM